MKEELKRVLNNKLNKINEDIDSLKELNKKIDEENEQLDFVDGIIGIFNEEGEKNPLNFDKIVKDDFTRAVDLAGEDVKKLFESNACNYDGLVYLISGIKNGVSISLTNDQMNGIEYFVQSLTNKKSEIESKIDELNAYKSKFEISDVNELKTKKDKYEKVVENVSKNEYVKDIDLLKEAIDFAGISSEEIIKLLSFVLEYNANLYKENKPAQHEEKKEEKKDVEETEAKEENTLEKTEESKETNDLENEETDENESEFHFNQIENDNLFELPNITFDDKVSNEVKEDLTKTKEENTIEKTEESKETNDLENEENDDYQVFKPIEVPSDEPDNEEEVKVEEAVETKEEKEENDIEFIPLEEDSQKTVEPMIPEVEEIPIAPRIDESVIMPIDSVSPIQPEVEETKEETHEEVSKVDDDFKDIINEKVDYETREKQEEEKTSTRELHKIFGKYGIEENIVLNELVDGDVNEYQNILDFLKERKLLDYFKKNKELLIETLLYSSTDVIDKVLRIIKEDLSVDDEDYEITLKIAVNTIPSIFIRDGGNYDNFIKNVELFKKLEINLINLFDFSKEVFVADNESVEKNLEIVNKYDFDIDYKNAKYFLLIPNIADKIDYYIESVYEDKIKNETFDGIKYIKDYAAKLNVVTDETIKRLRYASVNGKKVFGNKPGSLSGEITNLKVNSLDINDDYLSKFFNNQFSDITSDEVREYVKLVHNSSNVGDYSDELDKLSSYRNGLRYVIEGINVSYNKVLRNYSVLRSYGVETKKALQFAVCYNLVITKDEYNKLHDFLVSIGGNV